MRKLHCTLLYTLMMICCVTQTLSESMAASNGAKQENWRRVGESVIYNGETSTKVTVVGNAVLVPVRLVYEGNQADVQLLLDTGASSTMIKTEIGNQLGMNLESGRKIRVRVVGGQVIDGHVMTLSSLTVGPHAKKDVPITVIPHSGSIVIYDGLLGMDLLRRFKYRVDVDKQVMYWE